MENKRKSRIGDRKDGRKVRSLTSMSYVSPYIMKDRIGSQNLFSDSFDVSTVEKYIVEKRREGYKNFGMLHVLLASYVRVVSERPAINRFIAGQKIFTRPEIQIVMDIKKHMTLESENTCVKVSYKPDATAVEVYEKFNAIVEENKGDHEDSNFDNTARLFTHIPGVLLRFAIGFLTFLDYFGHLPKKLLQISPFHGSMFITSMGSLGIPPIYHHLYNFGNIPIFFAYGAKYNKLTLDKDGQIVNRRLVDFTVVTDERICDGFYYASSFKQFKRYLNNPWALDIAPETVKEDVN